jgi:hypothetical protein
LKALFPTIPLGMAPMAGLEAYIGITHNDNARTLTSPVGSCSPILTRFPAADTMQPHRHALTHTCWPPWLQAASPSTFRLRSTMHSSTPPHQAKTSLAGTLCRALPATTTSVRCPLRRCAARRRHLCRRPTHQQIYVSFYPLHPQSCAPTDLAEAQLDAAFCCGITWVPPR